MSKKITDKVTWVGKTDWELKFFHGKEYSTRRGSTYNSYLINDTKKVLIDTVWKPYDKEFVHQLKKEINLQDLDYIIMNHSEVDHSGAMLELMREIPEKPIYCTANGTKILRGHYHKDWNFVTVKTGDSLSIGDSTLTFVEAPMLHWPDTMFTYMSGENILFSTDAFGEHYATESLFNEEADQDELFAEAIKYYANILTPFSKLVVKKIEEVLGLGLPVSLICPSHGVIWREHPTQIVEKYLLWAKDYHENQITILYDTMWNATRKMAEAIASGIEQEDSKVKIKLMNTAKEDKNDIITEVFKSKAILLGAPTINNGVTHAIGGILEMLHGLKLKNKAAVAFGSYGWSGEGIKLLSEDLKAAGFQLLNDGLRQLWVPDDNGLEQCRQFGIDFIKALNQNSK